MPWYKARPAPDELEALVWAATEAGLSYGQFRNQVTPEKLADILCRYRDLKKRQRECEKIRLSKTNMETDKVHNNRSHQNSE